MVGDTRAVAHRARSIEHDGGAQARFFFVLAHVVAIGAGVDHPIEPTQIIAWLVRTVSSELDRQTAMDRTVLTNERRLDRLTGGDADLAQALEDLLLDGRLQGHQMLAALACEVRGARCEVSWEDVALVTRTRRRTRRRRPAIRQILAYKTWHLAFSTSHLPSRKRIVIQALTADFA